MVQNIDRKLVLFCFGDLNFYIKYQTNSLSLGRSHMETLLHDDEHEIRHPAGRQVPFTGPHATPAVARARPRAAGSSGARAGGVNTCTHTQALARMLSKRSQFQKPLEVCFCFHSSWAPGPTNPLESADLGEADQRYKRCPITHAPQFAFEAIARSRYCGQMKTGVPRSR